MTAECARQPRDWIDLVLVIGIFIPIIAAVWIGGAISVIGFLRKIGRSSHDR